MRASIHAMTLVLIAAPLVLNTATAADEQSKPVQVETNFEIDGAGVRPTMFTVPDGYELEIKFFSCGAHLPTGQFIFPSVRTTGGGGSADFFSYQSRRRHFLVSMNTRSLKMYICSRIPVRPSNLKLSVAPQQRRA